MAFGDEAAGFGMLTANVLMKFKVDTTEAKAKLRELTGEEKKAQDAAIKLQEAKNRQMESWAKGLAKVSAGVMLATKAVSVLGDSWKAYEKKAMDAGGADKEKALRFREALSSMSASMDKVKVAIGGIVANLAPLVELAASLLGIAGDVVNFLSGGSRTDYFRKMHSKWNMEHGGTGDRGGMIASRVGVWDANRQLQGWGQYANIAAGIQQGVSAIPKPRRGGGGGGIEVVDMTAEESPQARLRRMQEDADFNAAFDPLLSRLGSSGVDTSKLFEGADELKAWAADFEAKFADRQKRSVLESIFGKPDEFDLYAEKMQGLADAMDIVGQSMQSSFEAWVSGAATGKQALLDFFKGAITGIASHMFAKAIEHGALAVGSLAFQDYRGAALHGKAALAFGAGAVAVGALARAANGGYDSKSGGGVSVGGGTTAPSVSGGGGGQPVSGGNITVYAGDMMALDSQQRQRENFARVYRSARREISQSTQVRFQ